MQGFLMRYGTVLKSVLHRKHRNDRLIVAPELAPVAVFPMNFELIVLPISLIARSVVIHSTEACIKTLTLDLELKHI
ncbi:hypothetical protein OUZ56_012859 [Daphnia magna]|uniref:Uncharacterized protein n=1 Tax=Daphnia magna TaxID=35525 RepID=A0ABQ9Z496_9CRUS|nr:hypothetical protein OUZ56_012859 [Daphnia magna]